MFGKIVLCRKFLPHSFGLDASVVPVKNNDNVKNVCYSYSSSYT